jgi:putative transcriptional regulator
MAVKRLNIKILHEKTGLSRTTISQLFNEHARGIEFSTLAKLCDALDCDITEILVLEKKETDQLCQQQTAIQK